MRFIINSIWIGENKKSYPIRKLNQIALIFSGRIFITVDDNREMLPKRCHDNNLITAFGVFTPYFSGRLLFPLFSEIIICLILPLFQAILVLPQRCFSLSYSLYHHSCCKICCNYSKRIIPGGLYLVLSKRKARQLSRAFAIQAVMNNPSTSRVISEILSINSSSISLLSLSLFSCSRTSVSRSYTAL